MGRWSLEGPWQDICGPLSEANGVVVLFAGALGDFLLALPSVRLLRRRYDGVPLVLAVRAPLLGIAAHAACADRVVALDDRAMATFLGGGEAPAWWPQWSRVFSWFGGYDGATRARFGAWSPATTFFPVIRGEGAVHAACAYAEAIGEPRAWGELCALGRLEVPVSDAPRVAARSLVIHRGAGAPAKCWSEAGFAAVASWWHRRGGTVVELLGPAEQARGPLSEVAPFRDQPLLAVAGVLGSARAYVGNDTGPSHLAAALDTPGVVLFGPTDPTRWRPLSARLEAVRAPAVRLGPDGFADPPAHAVIARLAAALP
jgi:ADP-heptose:LPS heptosyltransferase